MAKGKPGTCIYCGTTGQMSLEHSFPEALGVFSGLNYLDDRVCRDCNGNMGRTIEEQFLKTGTIGMFRWILGIEGKDGVMDANLFERGSGKGTRTEMVAFHPEAGTDVLFEFLPGTRSPRELRQIIARDAKGDLHAVRIPERAREDFEVMLNEIRRVGLDPDSIDVERAFFTADEAKWVEEICTKLAKGKKKIGEVIVGKPGMKIRNPELSNTHTRRFFRAIAKVAFHIFLSEQPGARGAVLGSEPQFKRIRDYITMEENGPESPVRVVYTDPVLSDRLGVFQSRYGHNVVIDLRGPVPEVGLQFFVGPDHAPVSYWVCLSDEPLELEPRWLGLRLVYWEAGEEGKYDCRADCVPGPA